jgi:hypothetical protein
MLAESLTYKHLGYSVIGMTNRPEAKLAREAEICYATVAMVTDFDCWHPDHDAVGPQCQRESSGQQHIARIEEGRFDDNNRIFVPPDRFDRPVRPEGSPQSIEHDRIQERRQRVGDRGLAVSATKTASSTHCECVGYAIVWLKPTAETGAAFGEAFTIWLRPAAHNENFMFHPPPKANITAPADTVRQPCRWFVEWRSK